jgi:hypothetical protein
MPARPPNKPPARRSNFRSVPFLLASKTRRNGFSALRICSIRLVLILLLWFDVGGFYLGIPVTATVWGQSHFDHRPDHLYVLGPRQPKPI